MPFEDAMRTDIPDTSQTQSQQFHIPIAPSHIPKTGKLFEVGLLGLSALCDTDADELGGVSLFLHWKLDQTRVLLRHIKILFDPYLSQLN
jgi:hypothetical protein